MNRFDTHADPALRVTVVLCTYNGARYLSAQLDSLLAQERSPDRIAIADDASSDATWTLLEAFAARARARGIEVDLQRNPRNLGYLRNFEAALARAGAGLVFLCDQDDVWHPNKIGDFVERFRADPGLIALHSDSRLVDGEGRDLGGRMFQTLEVAEAELQALHEGRGFEVLVRRNIVTGATLAMRRELIDRALPIPNLPALDIGRLGWVHDEWLALIAAATGRIDCIEAATIDYRQHGGNQIGARRRSLAERLGGGKQRREHMQAMVAKLESLRAHIDRAGLAVDAGKRAMLDERLNHLQLRLGLSPRFLQRWPLIRQEWRHGRYRRYSAGLRSLVCDLLGLR
ncbi:glycosyltransferase family 2 protein [Lysobacter firmicutimachus]|uniref:Glycosyltransferase family 2 protein n=1 Tax=Lysobacter firmicutimachus TaxID=1792846 RepID=A0AAU8MVB7_9GAMM|nr:glycosyltransferase family 2 protein [Lysobacter antibioticus]